MNQCLSELIRHTTDAKLGIRYFAISHFKGGKSCTQISKYLNVSRESENQWVPTYYLKNGLKGLSPLVTVINDHQATGINVLGKNYAEIYS